ncbi:GtrA family protein [Protaetiibacter sp. SSC-01]|uniref:GtrA family protein n=1 Tax=Protaetiibacter sp. SSC-01 TaxID=2759943 RepID=UPI0016569176|nr:GtrA family protein [Protaetiibacter sp. SSC-01]QNO37048.1 GtrA family protein [Protaetiibacter sp. SSC-01]
MRHVKAILGILRTREFWTFFGGSAAGLAVDLVGFQLLVWAGLPPWLANGTSSVVSITVVYLLVTRYTFGVGTRLSTYVLFVGWYLTSIVVFSSLIQLAVSLTDWVPFAWKLVTVPISFSLNYLFSRFLFLPKQKHDAELLEEETPDDGPEGQPA